ncbi:hypothetical protein G3I65_30525 [Amycolatopsis sp. SID8362]|nr:hypothetical protein [Amycolatopsis sp. SID8362]
MPKPFRADRSAEIRRILAVNTSLLNALLETQREQLRQLGGGGAARGSLEAEVDSLDRMITDGFAELTNRVDQLTQLVRQLADKA